MAQRYIFLMFLFQTPLHFAAFSGKGVVVEILVRNGANINEKNVRNTSVGVTDDFEKERERESLRDRQGAVCLFLCVREGS